MGIKDALFGLIDNVGLAEKFSLKPHDPTAARKPLLKGIGNAKRQFENGQTKAPNRWWRVNNDVVALTVKLNGDTFNINGVATNHMPAERFPEFLDKMKAAVEAGEFDAELKNKGNGDAKVVIGKAPASSVTRASPTDALTGVRRSVGKSLSNGKSLDEIEASLKAAGKYAVSDIDTVIAERRAAK